LYTQWVIGKACVNSSIVVMEDLEGSMQVGAATSPYMHRMVIRASFAI
jgi:hypothetical protein